MARASGRKLEVAHLQLAVCALVLLTCCVRHVSELSHQLVTIQEHIEVCGTYMNQDETNAWKNWFVRAPSIASC